MKKNDYVSIVDARSNDVNSRGKEMLFTSGKSPCGIVYKVHDDLCVTVVLPSGHKQKIPRGRCQVIDKITYFKLLLKGKQ